MKKLLFTVMVCALILVFVPVTSAETGIEPGMSAVLNSSPNSGAYYYVGYDIPEGSYIFTCIDNEETEWADGCSVTLTTYDQLQYSADLGKSLNFPDRGEGFGSVQAFLRAGTLLRVQYGPVKITAAAPVFAEKTHPEPGSSAILDGYAYYGIGYDIPEGDYYLSCVPEENSEWYDGCEISISAYDYFLYDENSLMLFLGSYGEEDPIVPQRIFLKSGTVLENMGSTLEITAAEPVIFE